jgi:hypothetical protein
MFAAPLIAAFGFQPSPSTPPIPPMKMGLWETTSTANLNGNNILSHMPGLGSRTVKSRYCITPDTFEQAWNSQSKSCTRENVVTGPKSFSYDMTCGKSTGHYSMTFETKESGSYTLHMVNGSQTIDTAGTTTFISSDCGSVAPGKPQMVK